MDQNALQQIIDRLKEANNVLVTVSTNPSVDQLAACIGFTLLLNHLGKHGTAVFSGAVPSTIEFLKPDDTLEKNTDSLRDFIIALDKSKADKLRYKVEDTVVKIFITPYRTSISDKDLDFSQGDFNVDAVLALGVHERTDLDKAIMDHGRILHDATVISVNNKDQGNLGAINWVDLNASSLSEMLVELVHGLTNDPLDGQMATAFMTGIVAETERVSNTKTSPRTMSLAAELMSAGANQQLIASKLEASKDIPTTATKIDDGTQTNEPNQEAADGSLQISHVEAAPEPADLPKPVDTPVDQPTDNKEEAGDALGGLSTPPPPPLPPLPPVSPPAPVNEIISTDASEKDKQLADDMPAGMPNRASMALEPPTMGGQLTANSVPESMQVDASPDPLSLPAVDRTATSPQILNRPADLNGMPILPVGQTPTQEPPQEPANEATDRGEQLEDAREAVDEAIAAEPSTRPLDPIAALGAQPVNLDLRGTAPAEPASEPMPQPNPVFGGVPNDAALPTLPSLPPVNPEPAPAPISSSPSMPPLQPLAPPEPSLAPAPPATPMSEPFPAAAPAPAPAPPPLPGPQPFGAPPEMNGVNPNVPTSLLPPSQPIDSTAGSANPSAPPPVPPPLMPPSDAI
jgi:hypothetical protein